MVTTTPFLTRKCQKTRKIDENINIKRENSMSSEQREELY